MRNLCKEVSARARAQLMQGAKPGLLSDGVADVTGTIDPNHSLRSSEPASTSECKSCHNKLSEEAFDIRRVQNLQSMPHQAQSQEQLHKYGSREDVHIVLPTLAHQRLPDS